MGKGSRAYLCHIGGQGPSLGAGLLGSCDPRLSSKKEGDFKTPCGLFQIGKSFAFGHHPHFLQPQVPIQEDTLAVDDPNSQYYNTVLNQRNYPSPDWNSAEKMAEEKIAYRYGLEILHNPPLLNKIKKKKNIELRFCHFFARLEKKTWLHCRLYRYALLFDKAFAYSPQSRKQSFDLYKKFL